MLQNKANKFSSFWILQRLERVYNRYDAIAKDEVRWFVIVSAMIMAGKRRPPRRILLSCDKFADSGGVLYRYILTSSLGQSKVKNVNVWIFKFTLLFIRFAKRINIKRLQVYLILHILQTVHFSFYLGRSEHSILYIVMFFILHITLFQVLRMEFTEDPHSSLLTFRKTDGGSGYRLLCGGNKPWLSE